jgi:PAS domain-containing protein
VDPTAQERFFGQVQTYVEDADAIIYLRDRQGRYVWVNDTYGRVLPFTRDQVIGHTNRDLYGEAAQNWEIADGLVWASRSAMITREQLQIAGCGKWRDFVSTKLILAHADTEYLVGVSVEVRSTSAEAEQTMTAIYTKLLKLFQAGDLTP